MAVIYTFLNFWGSARRLISQFYFASPWMGNTCRVRNTQTAYK